MEGIFAEILNMSMISCIVIVAVMVIRQIFRRAPKAFFCILWAFVGFRLICPFTQAGMSVYFAERIMFNSRQSADYRRSIFTGECTREIRISDREI